jgi:SAM-dependent methyltransferase
MNYYPPRYLFRRQTIFQVLQNGSNFLEIGPGNFLLARELLKYYQQGTLIDFNPKAKLIYQALPDQVQRRLDLLIGNFMDYSFSGTYDCIIACEVMEHVQDDRVFLQKIYELLVEEGQIIISVPARMKMWSIHDQVVGHLRRYEKKELKAMVEKMGFRQVRIDSYGYPFVNIFGLLRIRTAKKMTKRLSDYTQETLTKFSGIDQTEHISKYLGFLINPVSFYPATLISRFFNQYDLSDGYLLSANK